MKNDAIFSPTKGVGGLPQILKKSPGLYIYDGTLLYNDRITGAYDSNFVSVEGVWALFLCRFV